MGNSQSTIKINYEFVQSAITSKNTLLINTMKSSSQECLISTTLSIDEEESVLNSHVGKNKTLPIIVYGINSCDDTVDKKYKQLTGLGFQNVYLYPGGIFEWLLLQDIYGKDILSITSLWSFFRCSFFTFHVPVTWFITNFESPFTSK